MEHGAKHCKLYISLIIFIAHYQLRNTRHIKHWGAAKPHNNYVQTNIVIKIICRNKKNDKLTKKKNVANLRVSIKNQHTNPKAINNFEFMCECLKKYIACFVSIEYYKL